MVSDIQSIRDFDRSLAETLNIACKLILEEFENFLKDKEIAKKILYCYEDFEQRWNDVKRGLN